MKSSPPFSIRLFVADGDPDGLRTIERSNWNGFGLIFPRTLFPQVKRREEFGRTGVYLLLGPREDGEGELLYIGQGDPVRPRLEQHFSKKDFWTRALFFVTAASGGLNSAQVGYLEARLIELAREAKRVRLDNVKNENPPTLSEADRADMEVFLGNLLQILPLLGIDAFERPLAAAKPDRRRRLYVEGKGIKAEGYESSGGFVVMAGSQVVTETVPSMKKHVGGMYELRRELIESGVIDSAGSPYCFSQDYTFRSPSTAAAVVLGRSANGRVEWHDSSGRTLKAIQEALAGEV
ncbi:GIY-YIG nuclease family protein [Endothiovibrio diazotrophicus]